MEEATGIQIQGRSLSHSEMARVQAIYEAIPHLDLALEKLKVKTNYNLITYKIVSDVEGKLKNAARVACNFWNRYLIPDYSVVIRLDIFTSNSHVIARAYRPYEEDGVHYGVVEFNTKYLTTFSRNEIAGTIIHEIGHSLGVGWSDWENLFDKTSGEFKDFAINMLDDLKDMRVETDYGSGTQYSHWDEKRHGEELMTGFKDKREHVLPITIDVMELLGHQIAERLPQKTDLNLLLDVLAQVVFTRKFDAKALNLDHFEKTEIWENVPHSRPIKKAKKK